MISGRSTSGTLSPRLPPSCTCRCVRRRLDRGGSLVLLCALGLSQASGVGCGKKGAPLAPLRLVPAAVAQVDARRSGNEVELRFGLPTTNLNGPGPIELDRVEVYALTTAPGAAEPPNRDLLSGQRLVGTIAVRPPAVEGKGGAPTAATPADTRPAPGERVTFVEELTQEKLTPVTPPAAGAASQPGAGQETQTPAETPIPGAGAQAPAGAPAVPGAPSAASAQAPAGAGEGTAKPASGVTPGQPPSTGDANAPKPPAPAGPRSPVPDPRLASVPMRVYGIRGLTRGGRPGQPVRVKVPLVPPPPPPTGIAAKFTESAIALDWTPPVADVGGQAPSFNVYPAAGRPAPLNAAPLGKPAFEQAIAEYGKEACFVVRSVQLVAGVAIESESSAPACTTPQDIFPPPAPAGLQAVATPDAISLSWEASAAADLAGYVLLRGESPGDTLQPLTPEPIRETTYRDTTVKPGVTYVYAVVSLDKATPPNTSARSNSAAVTAR